MHDVSLPFLCKWLLSEHRATLVPWGAWPSLVVLGTLGGCDRCSGCCVTVGQKWLHGVGDLDVQWFICSLTHTLSLSLFFKHLASLRPVGEGRDNSAYPLWAAPRLHLGLRTNCGTSSPLVGDLCTCKTSLQVPC